MVVTVALLRGFLDLLQVPPRDDRISVVDMVNLWHRSPSDKENKQDEMTLIANIPSVLSTSMLNKQIEDYFALTGDKEASGD